MKWVVKEKQTDSGVILLKVFYIKINKDKLQKIDDISSIFSKLINRIKDNHHLKTNTFTIQTGLDGDDFIKNKVTVALTFNLN